MLSNQNWALAFYLSPYSFLTCFKFHLYTKATRMMQRTPLGLLSRYAPFQHLFYYSYSLSLLFLSLLPPHIIFFLHSLMHHILLHLHSLFSKNKNILLYNHRTLVKFITLIITPLFIFVIVPIMSFYNSFFSGQISHPKLCSSFSYHASSVSFNLKQFIFFLFYFVFMTFDYFY